MTNEPTSNCAVLPDGSAFGVMSLPLPPDHWIFAPACEEWDEARDTTADTPHPILSNEQRGAVAAAVRYAVRAATLNGREMDFDPDALVQNAVYALCGPYGLAYQAPAAADNEPNFCESCAMDLATCDCVNPIPVWVRFDPPPAEVEDN